jgi:periplasmic protein TonB
MSERFKRILVKVIGIHVGLILGLMIWPWITQTLFRPKPKDIFTFIDMSVGVPEVPTIPTAETKQPQAQPKVTEPAPTPPESQKDVITEPKKTKPKIEKSTKKVKRPDSTTQPQPSSSSQKGPKLTADEIKKLLAAGYKPGTKFVSGSGNGVPFSWYYALVRQIMYDAWLQPGSLSAAAGLITEVTIRVQPDGTVTEKNMVRSSGNSLMDESVMKAVESVKKIRPLPPELGDSFKDITIQFELTGSDLF